MNAVVILFLAFDINNHTHHIDIQTQTLFLMFYMPTNYRETGSQISKKKRNSF